MSDIFQIASVAMLQGRQQLEAISMNAMSVSLPGYRRQIATPAGFEAALGASQTSTGAPSIAQAGVDLRAGALRETGRPLDVAIEGGNDMFFAMTDGTSTWLSRAGEFRLSGEGVLIGEGGLRVVGVQGDVRLPSSDVVVHPDGRIEHEGSVVAALQLFRPVDGVSLRAAKGTLLHAVSGIQPVDPGLARVRAGALEASNSDPTREMLSMIALSRRFEGLSQIVQGYDAALGRAIQKLGDL